MDRLANKTVSINGVGRTAAQPVFRRSIDLLANFLTRLGLVREDADYHLLRGAMVIIFFFFGYQKWFAYEAYCLVPFISHGPLLFCLYPALGVRGASVFLGVCEWAFGTLLLLGFWSNRLGILVAIGSTA